MDNKALARIMHSVVKLDNGCWLWIGKLNTTGYPLTSIKGKHRLARRLLYQHYIKALEPSELLTNTCNDRLCVNPNHHEASTRSAISKAHPAQAHKTCHNGHPRTPENIHLEPSGDVVCVVCFEAKYGYKPYMPTTHCPNGHEYTPENTYYRYKANQTGKMCKRCNAERGKVRVRKSRAKPKLALDK